MSEVPLYLLGIALGALGWMRAHPGLQGYLTHKKTPTPLEDHPRTLDIGLR